MSAPEDVLADSPADFDSSFAYALHGEMRRLLIVTILGSVMLPLGLALFIDPGVFGTGPRLLRRVIGLAIGIAGAAFFYGGLVGVLFKVLTDASIVAAANRE